jgi:hypothetical protein
MCLKISSSFFNIKNVKKYNMEKGYILDYCGLDTADKYNGLYTDLCGMDVQDYINSTIFPCCGNGGDVEPDEPSEPIKKVNTIIFTVNSENYLVAYTKYAPLSNITVSCVCEGKNISMIIPSKSTAVIASTHIVTGETIVLTQVVITPQEDESYKYGDYTIVNKEVEETYVVYYDTVNKNHYSDLKVADIINFSKIIATNELQEINFKIKPSEFVPSDDASEEEYNAWEQENAHLKALVVPSSLYVSDNERYFDLLLNDTSAFVGYAKVKEVTIDNVKYCVLVDTDEEGFINESTTEEMIIGTYNFILTK